MKHTSTRAVFEHWNRQRGNRPAPERNDIDPVAIRQALGDAIMLAADFADQLRFRLAGTRVCALFGREMKGEEFTTLCHETSRQPMTELLGIVTGEVSGAVIGLVGRTEDGVSTDIEMLLLPLAYSRQARISMLGILAPIVTPYWLGAKPVAQLEPTSLRYVEPQPKSRTAAFGHAFDVGRVRRGFRVYSGGLESPSDEQTG
jgi:hypothetical protein